MCIQKQVFFLRHSDNTQDTKTQQQEEGKKNDMSTATTAKPTITLDLALLLHYLQTSDYKPLKVVPVKIGKECFANLEDIVNGVRQSYVDIGMDDKIRDEACDQIRQDFTRFSQDPKHAEKFQQKPTKCVRVCDDDDEAVCGATLLLTHPDVEDPLRQAVRAQKRQMDIFASDIINTVFGERKEEEGVAK